MATRKSELDILRSRFTGHPAHGGGGGTAQDDGDDQGDDEKPDGEAFAVICMVIRWQLTTMMQAALVRDVAFNMFANYPHAFEGHPSSSLTWRALDALEGSSIVDLVETLRSKLFKRHVPATVNEKLEKLVGHRHRISHPSYREVDDWRDPRMQQFEAEGRRYESCVPLVWDLQRAINAELSTLQTKPLIPGAATPIPDFYVTREMSQQLRTIYVATLKDVNVPNIPEEATLLQLLQSARDITLQQCLDRANGVPAPPKRETALDRLWAEQLRKGGAVTDTPESDGG
jgi:hypothetical protein